MKDSRTTRTSKLPQYTLKKRSNKPSAAERKRMEESLKTWNINDNDAS